MRKISAYLFNKKLDIYSQIELPATAEEISDALDQSRDFKGVNKTALLDYLPHNLYFLFQSEMKECNIYEMNYFTELLVAMEPTEVMQFEGLVQSELSPKKELKISELINLIMHLKQCEVMNINVTNDCELGKFYVDNDFVDEVNADTPKWVLDNLDYKKIGSDMRESENGQFVKGGYVVNSAEIKQLYDGKFPKPIPVDYVFKFGISKSPTVESLSSEPKMEELVELKLPTSNERYMKVIKSTGAEKLSNCAMYRFTSIVPQLDGLWESLNDIVEIESINDLALKIETMKQFKELTKYKALLSTIDKSDIDLDTALNVFGFMSEFELNHTLDSDSQCDKLKLEGADITPYGAVIPSDGVSLKEKMEQSQTPNQSMTIGGLS